MFGLRLMIQSAFTLLSYASGGNGDIMPPMVGGQRDSNDCLIGAGFTWCESSQECIRRWETPCADNFSDCSDCLKRQRNGENIACPVQCDIVNPILKGTFDGPTCSGCPPPAPCPAPGPDCEYSPPITDECGCSVGCGQINCYAVDPLPRPPAPVPPAPVPPAHVPHLCSEVMCMMYCENGNQIDENGCNICACNTVSPDVDKNQVCPIPYEECFNEYVCPKVTEVTTCGEGGIRGYTTYQLSLIIRPDSDVRNVFALFGDQYDNLNGEHPMVIPGAYQVTNVFGSNIGGVSESTTRFSQNSMYDSWLTIGITDGDVDSKLGAIGIDFESWNLETPLVINNGAVFLLNPKDDNIRNNEIIVGQITLPNERVERVILSAQGKLYNSLETWKQYDIVFYITPPVRNDNPIPLDCVSWYDGCNTCRVDNGIIGACTRMMCFQEDEPYCMSTSSGH